MKKLLLGAVLLSAFAGPVSACVPMESKELIEAVQAKFGLVVRPSGGCAGPKYWIQYRPAEPVVPAGSYFASWNRLFVLGELSGDEQMRALLALEPEQVRALSEAKTAFTQDNYELENSIGVDAYHPNALLEERRVRATGMLMYVSVPHCRIGGMSQTSEIIGEIELPVMELEGLALVGKTPLYKKGDLRNALFASPAVLARLRGVAADNAQAMGSEDRDHYYSLCGGSLEPNSFIDWNAVQELR